jgi:prevent-host-death family protein
MSMWVYNVDIKRESGTAMSWNIAQAKQQFSEVVRLSAKEPQAIYNRETAVAAVISAEEYAQFQEWRIATQEPTLEQQFDELRQALAEVGFDELPTVPRKSLERPNSFLDALVEASPKTK